MATLDNFRTAVASKLGLDNTVTGDQPLIDGLCECGCGEATSISAYTDTARGRFKGKPYRYVRGHNRRLSGTAYLVEDRGYETPCWIWQRSKNDRGYGQCLGDNGKVKRAHRVYWEREHGPVPDGLELDHLCRNRDCVNPEHLEAVTHIENSRRGARLTVEAARDIRVRALAGKRGIQREIAAEYGVHFATVNKVVKGHNWRDV